MRFGSYIWTPLKNQMVQLKGCFYFKPSLACKHLHSSPAMCIPFIQSIGKTLEMWIERARERQRDRESERERDRARE